MKICIFAILSFIISATAYAGCRNDMPRQTPTAHFIDHGDGTVTHMTTGLMWMRCRAGTVWTGSGCGSVGNQNRSWLGALQNAQNTTFAGYTDWRVPNLKELNSIVDRSCTWPAVNSEIFPDLINGLYLVVTPVTTNANKIWSINLHYDGSFNNSFDKTSGVHYLYLVRDAD